MKKLICVLLCLMLVLPGAVRSADAADNAHMSLIPSAGTLFRGDSFTLTVELENDRKVGSGGVILSYDSSVFEFLEGSCHVEDTLLAEVSQAHNGGVFVLRGDAVVSGTVFTISMRVKDSAPFGSHTISGSPSLDGVSCTISSTGVSVACRHAYGSPVRVDGGQHESACTICGHKEAADHTWDGYALVQAATCKDTGTGRLTCTACGAVRDETIPVNNDHSYGPWTATDDGGHSRSCTVCGKTETEDHAWDGGTVTLEAACQQEGQREFRCTVCDAARTEPIPAGAHEYGPWVFADEAAHQRNCDLCGGTEQAAHTFTDHVCTVCGFGTAPAATEPAPEFQETVPGHGGGEFPWQILWIAAACGLIGGYLLLKKRRT